MPTNHGSPLEAALSYYSHIVTVNAEGDSSVSEDTLEGLGMKGLLLNTLFGSILRLAQPPPTPSPSLSTRLEPGDTADTPTSNRSPSSSEPNRSDASRNGDMTTAASSYSQAAAAAAATAASNVASGATATSRAIRDSTETTVKAKLATSSSAGVYGNNENNAEFLDGVDESDSQMPFSEILVNEEECEDVSESRLMSLLPEPGYFAAGALSGGISRTATAPIDRLKVYLLVDSKSKTKTVLTAAKAGYGLAALRQAGTPVTAAITDLYKTGGFRTFFAGKQIP